MKKNEDTIMGLADKEKEIMNSYDLEYEEEVVYEDFDEDEEEEIVEIDDPEDENIEEDNDEDYEEFTEEKEVDPDKKVKTAKKIVNTIFAIIMIILVMIAVDVIGVARYDVGPFFVIPGNKYDDGGSRAYYGIGYKVIKYHQIQGRRDKEIGFWSLKYNTEPITFQDLDLSIETSGNEVETYKKYYKKFVRVISTLQKVDKENHQLTLGYLDEGGKYSLDIVCEMVVDQNDMDSFEEGKEITIIGTVREFKGKTDKKNNRFYITNCFAEQ